MEHNDLVMTLAMAVWQATKDYPACGSKVIMSPLSKVETSP